MDKLIEDLESLVTKYSSCEELFAVENLSDVRRGRYMGRDDVCESILRLLSLYRKRQQLNEKSHNYVITSDKRRLIDLLVDNASDYWQLLPDGDFDFDDLPAIDAFRQGYVTAVLLMMDIFDIDLKLVVK